MPARNPIKQAIIWKGKTNNRDLLENKIQPASMSILTLWSKTNQTICSNNLCLHEIKHS